ncbi:O-acetyl-ADP-ribose deacetylase [Thauera phenolivorans]|nr:O-acetyl-ADP-ribose deacetylase [Thauera phenolivorans]
MSEGEILARALGGRVLVMVGDLTEQKVDAIVNAANSGLLGGGGVDGAIHRRGGPAILAECSEIRRTTHPDGLSAGEAVITTGGALPARHVVHTVGPVYGQEDGAEEGLLASCYRKALGRAREHGLKTLAFPAISTGIFGYPADAAARVVSRTLQDELAGERQLEEVRLVFFDREQAETFLAAADFDPPAERA